MKFINYKATLLQLDQIYYKKTKFITIRPSLLQKEGNLLHKKTKFDN